MFKCYKCGFTSSVKKAFSNHLSRTEKISGEELERLKLKTYYPELDIDQIIKEYLSCETCVSSIKQKYGADLAPLLTILGIKRSHKEEKATARYQKSYADSCMAKFGESNPSKLKAVKDKKQNTYFEKYGVKCNLQIPEVRKKANLTWNKNVAKHRTSLLETLRARYGVDNPAKIPLAKLKNSISQKSRFAAMAYEERLNATAAARAALTAMPNWTSKIEERVFNLCVQKFQNVRRHVFLFRYNFDLQIGKTLIEVNGDFWHANPAKGYKPGDELLKGWTVDAVWDKDAKKQRAAEEAGYKVVTLWEQDINAMSDDVIMNVITTEVLL